MIVRHSLPTKNFVRLDRYVFTSQDLTDGAKVLYGFLCSLRNGASFSDAYITKALNISQSALARRRRELTAAGLILVDQVAARVHVVYIGFTNLPAALVKEQWVEEDAQL